MMRSPQTVKIVNKRYTVFYRMAKLRHLAKQKLDVYLFHNNHQVRFHKKKHRHHRHRHRHRHHIHHPHCHHPHHHLVHLLLKFSSLNCKLYFPNKLCLLWV